MVTGKDQEWLDSRTHIPFNVEVSLNLLLPTIPPQTKAVTPIRIGAENALGGILCIERENKERNADGTRATVYDFPGEEIFAFSVTLVGPEADNTAVYLSYTRGGTRITLESIGEPLSESNQREYSQWRPKGTAEKPGHFLVDSTEYEEFRQDKAISFVREISLV